MFQDRYIFASALQKSIRRGLLEPALQCANILAENDYNYLIYRLGIILTEDVGVSNTILLNKYLDLKISKKQIDEAGGKEFVFEIIKEACDSIKDRSSCDLAYFSSSLTSWSINKPEFQQLISSNPEHRLSLICQFLNSDINPVLKTNLIWSALGQRKYPNEELKNLSLFEFPKLKNGKDDDNVENFRTILTSLNLTDAEISATINAHATQNEFMCLGMALTYYERTKHINSESKNGIYQPKIFTTDFSTSDASIYNAFDINIPNAAIDHHTSQGKAAYTMFLRKKGHYYKYMETLGFDTNSIHSLLPFFMFRLEGHEVNKREYFKFASVVMFMASQIALNHKLGLDFNDKQFSFKNITLELTKDIPDINVLRNKTLNFNKTTYPLKTP